MRARRLAPVVFAVLLVLVGAAADLSADRCETPIWYYGWEIQPYMFDIGDAPEMRGVAEHQGYIISSHGNPVASFDPEPLVTDVEGEYGNQAGIGLISSHGSLRGQAIEVYPYTQAGKDSRDSAYTWYVNNGYAGKVYKSSVANKGWHISIEYNGAVNTWTDLSRALIDNETCFGGQFGGWNGARVWFGPPGKVTFPNLRANVRALWEGLDGVRGKAKRVAGQAYLDAPDLIKGGDGFTTLAPAVEACYPPEGFIINEDPVYAWVAFDSKMDIGGDPENLVYGSDGAFVEDQRWIRGERDTLRFTLWSVEVNNECFAVLGDHITSGDTLKSEGGMALDGNLNPYGSDGEGPNRDAFGMLCDCWYRDSNFAAALGSRWAYADGGVVVVGWHTEAEWETREYVVEAGSGDYWHEVGRVARGAVVAPDVYSLKVDAGYELYRIVEIDKRGKRSLFRPMRVRDHVPPFLAGLLNRPAQPHGSTQIDKACCPSGPGGVLAGAVLAGGPLSPEVPDWVFYGPDSLLAECGPAVAWFESKGYSVDLASATSPYY